MRKASSSMTARSTRRSSEDADGRHQRRSSRIPSWRRAIPAASESAPVVKSDSGKFPQLKQKSERARPRSPPADSNRQGDFPQDLQTGRGPHDRGPPLPGPDRSCRPGSAMIRVAIGDDPNHDARPPRSSRSVMMPMDVEPHQERQTEHGLAERRSAAGSASERSRRKRQSIAREGQGPEEIRPPSRQAVTMPRNLQRGDQTRSKHRQGSRAPCSYQVVSVHLRVIGKVEVALPCDTEANTDRRRSA